MGAVANGCANRQLYRVTPTGEIGPWSWQREFAGFLALSCSRGKSLFSGHFKNRVRYRVQSFF